MKKIIPKINFNKKDFIKILIKCASCKRLLFIIFFGTLLIFTVDVVYKYAFINIEYVNYTKDNNFIITDGKINNVNLNRVLKNIDKNKEKIEEEVNKKYKDPFSFDSSEYLKEDENKNSENLSVDLDG
jgi:uncharacterized membrane protein YcaP (DUF421 family)